MGIASAQLATVLGGSAAEPKIKKTTMEHTTSIDEKILEYLSSPVKTATGEIALDMNGNEMTALDCIAMSITQKAMKGDTTAAAYIKNIKRQSATQDEEARRIKQERVTSISAKLRDDLEIEGLYFGQDLQIEVVANYRLQMEDIEQEIASPTFDKMIADTRKDGTQVFVPNPAYKLYDDLCKKYTQARTDLINEARTRKSIAQHYKRKR